MDIHEKTDWTIVFTTFIAVTAFVMSAMTIYLTEQCKCPKVAPNTSQEINQEELDKEQARKNQKIFDKDFKAGE